MRKEFWAKVFALSLLVFAPLREKGRIFMDKTNKQKQNISNTKRLVGTAVFSALAYVVSMLEFPIFPATPFLKLDFSAVFLLLAGFIFGTVYGIGACAVKELISFITKSSTGGVGELANFLVIGAFILIPTLVYHYRKGIKVVVLTLIIACFVQVALSLLVNRFINFPLYMGEGAKPFFESVWQFVALFNLIKSIAVSVLTIVFYKKLSAFIKSI